ncbi:YwmB family TATA-box binding protein [Paenibacillus sp. M1]|uniref:YwmB family TATA-box binding protein n=1 Tax=Paenibacillus haidiansis TaxID=1574488 RepID=A0ABU7VXE4_9BACL
MRNPGSKGKNGAVAGAGCVLLLIVLLWMGNFTDEGAVSVSGKPGDSVGAAADQWDKLLALGKELIGEEIQGTVKWQGEWNTLLAPEEAAGALSSRLGFSAMQRDLVQDHTVYYSTGSVQRIASKLTVTLIGEGEYYVVLRMEGQGQPALAEMNSQMSIYGESLADEGVVVRWNAALQGNLEETAIDSFGQDNDEDRGSLEARIQNVESYVSRELKLEPLENYNEVETVSRTYSVPGFPVKVASGERQVALQIAVHRNAETGQEEISIGSPLLTVEY